MGCRQVQRYCLAAIVEREKDEDEGALQGLDMFTSPTLRHVHCVIMACVTGIERCGSVQVIEREGECCKASRWQASTLYDTMSYGTSM